MFRDAYFEGKFHQPNHSKAAASWHHTIARVTESNYKCRDKLSLNHSDRMNELFEWHSNAQFYGEIFYFLMFFLIIFPPARFLRFRRLFAKETFNISAKL